MKKHLKGGAMVVLLFLVTASLAFTGGQTETAAGPAKLTVALEAGRHSDAGIATLAAFETLHPNIKVEIVALPYTTFQAKTIQQFSAGSGAYDVTTVTSSNMGMCLKNDWILPIDQMIEDAKLDVSDFVKPMMDVATLVGKADQVNPKGKIWALPWNSDLMMLVYRKDLYQNAGLDIPTSQDELLRAVRVLTDKDANLSGMILAGLDNATSHTWFDFYNISLNTGGGMPLTPDYRPNFVNDGNKKALELYHTYFSEGLVPKGSLEYTYAEKNTALAQGLGAQMTQWMLSCVKAVEDPSSSKVSGKVGYAPCPGGTGFGGGWVAVLAATTKFPQAAFTYLNHLTSHESTKVHNLDYGNGPVRKSVMATAEFKKAYSFAPGLLKAFETGVNPRLVVPDLTIWGKVQAVMNREIIKAATGKVSADEALATMNRLVERDLKEAGFLK